MLKIFLLFITLLVPTTLLAALQVHKPALPYEPLVLSGSSNMTEMIIGDLINEPHLFEFTIDATSTVSLQLSQKSKGDILPLTILLIKVEPQNRGVKEVARVTTDTDEWVKESFYTLGLDLRSNKILSTELMSGLYRFEVSSPDNFGKYLVRFKVGTDQEVSLSLEEAVQVRKFFDYSGFTIIFTARVLWPLSAIILLLVITWFGYRRFRS